MGFFQYDMQLIKNLPRSGFEVLAFVSEMPQPLLKEHLIIEVYRMFVSADDRTGFEPTTIESI